MTVNDVTFEIDKARMYAKFIDTYMEDVKDEHMYDAFKETSAILTKYVMLLSSLPVNCDFKF